MDSPQGLKPFPDLDPPPGESVPGRDLLLSMMWAYLAFSCWCVLVVMFLSMSTARADLPPGYTGPKDEVHALYNVSTLGAEWGDCAADKPGCALGTLTLRMDTYRASFGTGGAWFFTPNSNGYTDLPALDLINAQWTAYGQLESSVFVMGSGTQRLSCGDSSRALFKHEGRYWCTSPCADRTGVEVQLQTARLPGVQSVPLNVCQQGSPSCEARPTSVSGSTYNGVDLWVGAFVFTGLSCALATPIPTAVAEQPYTGGSGADPLLALQEMAVNTGRVADQTASTGAINSTLRSIREALSPSLSLSATLVDCSKQFTCSGDPARCAELVYQRRAYCDTKPIDEVKNTAAMDLADGLLAKDAATVRNELKAGTVNLATSMARPRFLNDVGCPTPETVTLNYGFGQKTFTISFQPLCDIAMIVRVFMILGCSIIAIKIFMGGFN